MGFSSDLQGDGILNCSTSSLRLEDLLGLEVLFSLSTRLSSFISEWSGFGGLAFSSEGESVLARLSSLVFSGSRLLADSVSTGGLSGLLGGVLVYFLPLLVGGFIFSLSL